MEFNFSRFDWHIVYCLFIFIIILFIHEICDMCRNLARALIVALVTRMTRERNSKLEVKV